MSTILKALKTLETESGRDSGMSLPSAAARAGSARLASNRRFYARWDYARYYIWMGTLLLLVAGLGLGIYFWQDGFSGGIKTAGTANESAGPVDSSRKSPEPAAGRHMAPVSAKPQPAAGADSEPRTMPATRQAQSGQRNDPQQIKQSARSAKQTISARPSSTEQKTFEAGREVVGWSSAQSVNPPDASAADSGANPAGRPAKSEAAGRKAASQDGQSPPGKQTRQKKAGEPSPGKENLPGNESPAVQQASLPVFKDTGLEVQALSWDPNPENRITVINSSLCREGDRIGSYRIVTINPDDVVVARGSNRGRLVITRH